MTNVDKLISEALSTETYFTTLSPEARLELLAVMIIDRIKADIDSGAVLLEQLRECDE